MEHKKTTYVASDIKVLEGLAAVQKRPSMYIGNTASEGLHHLVYEVVDNSIDEALAGYCDSIDVRLLSDDSVVIIDNGRGIPVDMHKTEHMPALEVVMTKLHAGGKFDNKSYRVSGGLHGVGVSVVNALSEYLVVEVYRDGKIYHQRYERGKPKNRLEIKGDTKKRGTKIHFMPDNRIFEISAFDFEILMKRMRELSFLTKGVRIKISDERSGRKKDFIYEGGIKSFVEYLNKNKETLHRKPIYISGEKNGVLIEISLQYNNSYKENLFTFANNINTKEGGSHLSGFKSALTRSINQYLQNSPLSKNFKEKLTGDDVREGLTAVISVKLAEPQFEGQTKTKLGNSEVKGLVDSIVDREIGTNSRPVIIVETMSDSMYLNSFDKFLEDPNISMNPLNVVAAFSKNSVLPLSIFYRNHGYKTFMLLDNGEESKQISTQLLANEFSKVQTIFFELGSKMIPSIEDYMVLEDYLHAVNQTYEIKLRKEGFANLTTEDVLSRGKNGVLENLNAIWAEHKDDGWGQFDNEEITRYICEKIALKEADFLSDKTKDNFRNLFRLIAERIRQHQNLVSSTNFDKIPKPKV